MVDMCDVHCHILPEVDDGAENMDTALALLQKEYQDGVRKIIVTPHYRKGMFEPAMEKVMSTYQTLREEAAQIGISLYLGCEYHVNMDMVHVLQAGERPTMANSRYVLCEFSGASDAGFIRERSYHLLSVGMIPVLAHIERYPALTGDFEFIEELSEMGCLMQINAGSILGDSGFRVKRFCKKMMDYGFLDLIGSDCHDLSQRIPRMGECAKYLEKKAGFSYAKKILCDNPDKIIQNR